MLENEELIDEFKKSISSTVKSIGKSEEIEIEFIDGMPSISGKQVFLCSPDISSVRGTDNFYYQRVAVIGFSSIFFWKSPERLFFMN